MNDDAPIVALATAPGRGAVGVVRASGPDAAIRSLIAAVCEQPLKPRHAHYGALRDADGSALDHGLALYFPAPHSYTGESVLELQAHGGPVLLQLLLRRCLQALPGGRLAEAGEFTWRAFRNGKLDLAQAEAVADLIDAQTVAAARSAARSLGGAFSERIDALAEALVNLRVLVEATLDFPEEELDFLQAAAARERLATVRQRLAETLAQARQGARLRDGLHVVLAGLPNVGKSSLLNALAGSERAIVTDIAGTTRDRITEAIHLDGLALHITDTAGLRAAHEASDAVERIGIERSWQAIAQADVVLFVHDLLRAEAPAYRAEEAAIASALTEALGGTGGDLQAPGGRPTEAATGLREVGPRLIHVDNKADAVGAVEAGADRSGAQPPPSPPAAGDEPAGAMDSAAGSASARPADSPDATRVRVSARTGAGLDRLRAAMLEAAGWAALPEGLVLARERHVQALQQAAAALEAADAELALEAPALELVAEELRRAHDALGSITGRMTADALLGEIFGRFCIGK